MAAPPGDWDHVQGNREETLMFPDLPNFLVFLLAALVLLITPGPAVMYIIARSLDQGTQAGLASAAGAALGSLLQVGVAALGLAALLAASPLAFYALKLTGGAYLAFLGVQKIWQAWRGGAGDGHLSQTPGTVFRQAIAVNLLNPKVTLFFFAFLPQFTTPGRGSIPLQIAALGVSFVLLGLFTDSTYALFAGWISHRLKHKPTFQVLGNLVAGGVYLFLGVLAVFS